MVSEAIDFKQIYKSTKERMMMKCIKIKDFSLYNFLNNDSSVVIIDYRKESKELINKENGSIRGKAITKELVDLYVEEFNQINDNCKIISGVNNIKSQEISSKEINKDLQTEIEDETFNHKTLLLMTNVKIIIIHNDDADFQSKEFQNLRKYLEITELKIDKLYSINQTSYDEFLKYYGFFIVNSNTPKKEKLLAETNYPLNIIDGILFCGGFFNSRNLLQHQNLGIKSIIGLTAPDEELIARFKGCCNYITVQEDKKESIDFNEAYKYFQLELDENNYPILVYCFSGKTMSIALCIFILMKYKKLNLMGATAVMLKIIPDLKLPQWLYSQLQRVTVK